MPDLVSGLESGPLILFDSTGETIIISPLNQFMSVSMVHMKQKYISWGIMGKVMSIPKGYTYETILYHSDKGIRKVC